MTSKPNVIVVQKTTGKGTTIQGLPGKNVVTTLLNAGVRSHGPHVMRAGDDAALTMLCVFQGEKSLQAVSGAKPAIITASRPITKMIVTQPKSLGAGVQPTTATKIIPTKIVYGQQGKTQVYNSQHFSPISKRHVAPDLLYHLFSVFVSAGADQAQAHGLSDSGGERTGPSAGQRDAAAGLSQC